MIPSIGIMIGCYIITRCWAMALKEESQMVKGLSIITILVAILMTASLLLSGGTK